MSHAVVSQTHSACSGEVDPVRRQGHAPAQESPAFSGKRCRATGGFTLIEALVALAVVAISVVAIGSLMGAASRGARQLEQHVALVQAAYSALWSSFPPRSTPLSRDLSGQSMEAVWRADAKPFAIDFGAPTGEVLWVPQKIRLRVQSSSGAIIDLETIRLFRRPAE